MKRPALIGLIITVVIVISYLYYPRLFSPIYTLNDSGKILTLGSEDYFEAGIASDDIRLGRQIGRTQDGMRIYQVKGRKDIVILNGFMFPNVIYQKR